MNPSNFNFPFGNTNTGDSRFSNAGSGQGYASHDRPVSDYPAWEAMRYQRTAAPSYAYAAAPTAQPSYNYAGSSGPAFAASSGAYASAYGLASTFESSDDDSMMPWDYDSWVPRTNSGKQKSPNMIRNELQRYIDSCKADESSNQTRILERMGVNSYSFYKFMDPGTYKSQWNATQNGTYWAAAKLLEQVAYNKERAKISSLGKRRSVAAGSRYSGKRAKTSGETAPRKKLSSEAKLDVLYLLQCINSVEGVREGVVYDTCPQLVTKIKDFLQRDGMTKANLLLALSNINSNSLNTFLSGKRQDQCGNVTYRTAYVFFEKLRILEGKSRSAARLSNEQEHPYGFSLEKARPPRYVPCLPPSFYASHSAFRR